MRIVKAFLQHASAVEMMVPLPLKPGAEKNRFVVMEPAQQKLYAGIANDKIVKPQTIGGTWYPVPYEVSREKVEAENVVLHFHGGAFVIGDGREADAGYVCRSLVKHMGFKRAFAPQYRLASHPNCRFPAQLQDAITSYSYLVHKLQIPGNRITLSGDSAGGNLVLALLRYIVEFGGQVNLPSPAGALLWSPWVQIEPAKNPLNIEQSPHYKTDYLNGSFGAWGARCFAADLDATQPYMSPMLHPFKTGVPTFFQCGDAEVLYHDIVETYQKFNDVKGNVIGFHAEPNAPHDIALVGKLTAFTREFVNSAKKAAQFMEEHKKK